MAKYFLKVSLTLLFLTLLKNIVFAEVKLISPYNGEILEDRVVHFKWENTDPNTEYVYQHVRYLNERLDDARVKVPVDSNEEFTWGLLDNQICFWEVRYQPKETFEGYYNYKTDIFVLGVNKEIPDWAWDLLDEYNDLPQEEEMDEDIVVEEPEKIPEEMKVSKEETPQEEVNENKKVVVPKVEQKTKDVGIKKSIPKKIPTKPLVSQKPLVQEEDYNWNIKNSSVLGITQNKKESTEEILCKFKHYTGKKSLEKVFCNTTDIKITTEESYPFLDEYSLYIQGEIERNINIQIDTYDCVFNILKLDSWFKCNEKFLESEIITIRPHMFFGISQNGSNIPIRSFFLEGDSFKLLAGYTRNKENLKLTHTYRIINGKYNIFYDLKTEIPLNTKDISEEQSEKNTFKPFTFPFNKIIGVTQWYGFTDYQSPHTGIDFGATKEKVISVGNGEVVGKGWDSYYGECLSGGNFLKVKYPNGTHTTYFHLEDMYVNTGDLVKQGQIIAKSGNTGAWNCQPLAYHLHFETRLNSSYNSHTNPVPYINVDWNKVPTLGTKYNPGRLSGENPHPGR
ncbi:MAG TPA: M23 family metallopeptidase [Candidatus Dojkabacteria bacterium]|nr:M23 family metallopeptidase [Candidatus Dojkabacteria bacterium]